MEIKVGERFAQVNLLSKEGNKVSIEVDGKVYNVDVCMFADGQCSIINEGISYTPFVERQEQTMHYSVSLNYSVYEAEILDSRARYMRMRKQKMTGKVEDTIKAPMPSKVVKIFVEPGARVAKGDFLITIEAMKMQSHVVASGDFEVESVSCAEGDSVGAEQVLIKLKPIEPENK